MAQNTVHLKRIGEPAKKRTVPDKHTRTDESMIWLDFKKGDEASFIWIYREYFGKLFNFAKQFDLDSEQVKDHIQELFIYIRNNRERLADVRSIKFYLYKSLRRRILSAKKKKFSFLSLFASDNPRLFEIEVSESPEIQLIDQSINTEIRARLEKSMNRLTARQREAVLHFYFEGMSYREIADIMELKKVKSARKLIYRAIEALRKDLHGLKSKLY